MSSSLSLLSSPLLILLGIVISAYLTYLGTTYRYRTKPKDATTALFSYYEQMLKNVWEQSGEKDKLIDKLEQSLNRIQDELWETKNLLLATKQQLAAATKSNLEVQGHILATKQEIVKEAT